MAYFDKNKGIVLEPQDIENNKQIQKDLNNKTKPNIVKWLERQLDPK